MITVAPGLAKKHENSGRVVAKQQTTDSRPSQEAAQRPGAGVQDPFTGRKRPKAYRYDSSLDPQLWREQNRDREPMRVMEVQQ